MVWRAEDPQCNEAAKIKYLIVPYTRGKGLDIGSGAYVTYPHFTRVDDGSHNAMFEAGGPPGVECTADACDLPFKDGSQDFVFSSHCLEHIQDYRSALREWWRVLKVGGYLVLYLPDKKFYPRIGEKNANPDHKHDFDARAIEDTMIDIGHRGWDLVENEDRCGGSEYSFYMVFRKRDDTSFTHPWMSEKPKKSVIICRFGGFGDMMQTAAVLPEFKRQGYHITIMTHPGAAAMLANDPHVNAWILQDKDQVPNQELGAYWHAWSERCTRLVNFSESVEATWLAVPGRTNHWWPDSVRRKYMNVNYAEFMADLAEVPFNPPVQVFYPSQVERRAAFDFLVECRRKVAIAKKLPPLAPTPPAFFVLWTLAGSSVHKFYPGQDTVVARMMLEMPEAQVIFVGDAACELLEAGWEAEARVHRCSGKMEIRDSLALAQIVDCVVGPETGVLNAVCYEPVRKVVLLSHSSRENLTKHWANTMALEPKVPCYPCHRMHYTRQWCPEDYATGASVCAVSIKPEDVFDAIKVQYERWLGRTSQKVAA